MAIVEFKNGNVEAVIGNVPSDATRVRRIAVERTGPESWCAYFPDMVDVDSGVTGPDYKSWGSSMEHAIGCLLMKQVANFGAVISVDGLPIVINV